MIFEICQDCPRLQKAENERAKFTVCEETGRVLEIEFRNVADMRVSAKKILRPPCLTEENNEKQ